LIDSISIADTINQDRVYSTGMSNGGFMSYTLACSLSNRIAAIASVTGTMNVNQVNTCNVQHPMPVMEIHGTNDPTVPYTGIAGQMESTENAVNYWVAYNNCDAGSIFTAVPDINTFDGCTAEHYLYQNGDNGVEVEHYKIIDGAHTWPGAVWFGNTTNQDIDASFKIWEFFAKYDINGRIQSGGGTQVESINKELNEVQIYPNPANRFVTVGWGEDTYSQLSVFDVTGRVVLKFEIGDLKSKEINIENLENGSYIVQLSGESQATSKKKFLVTRH
ncbi:MAG: T9SS type A sorting domain-containing protein, partial [Flavobacteriales bacterium]|nr:T9SS type A sorting domain-containing protein [Flavobacteriales bacterium]